MDINVGSQAGVNLSTTTSNKELNYFLYGIGVYHFMHNKSRLVGGVYQTNRMLGGGGKGVGVVFGDEVEISRRYCVMGDWVSGNNDGSVSVIGGMVNVSRRVQLCAGWQIPNPETPKPQGLVLELNVMGWVLY